MISDETEIFLEAIDRVMPQIGFQSIARGIARNSKEKRIESLGVMVIVGVTQQLRGNIAYNMTKETARLIAEKMLGMPVAGFDELTESAVSELGNILAANATMIFEKKGVSVDISPPFVVTGESRASTQENLQQTIVEVVVDGLMIDVHISVVPVN